MPKALTSTRHFKLMHELRHLVGRMRPGDVFPTQAELMRQYEVSQATLDRALSRLRREGALRREMGRQRLTVGEPVAPGTLKVGIIRPDFPSPDFDEIVRTVSAAGSQKGWVTDTVYYHKLEDLDLWRAAGDNDAAVLIPDAEPFPERLDRVLRRPQKPVVVIQEVNEVLPVSTVCIDEHAVGQLAVEHLASLGHRRILAVNSQPPTRSALGRIAGWRDAMLELREAETASLEVASMVRPMEDPMFGTYEGFSAWLKRPHPRFTAVFVVCARGAMAIMRALREAGMRVPEDVSVIAYAGEAKLGPFTFPPLTAIESDRREYGGAVVAAMEVCVSGSAERVTHARIQPYMVVRQSTAPCPAGEASEGIERRVI